MSFEVGKRPWAGTTHRVKIFTVYLRLYGECLISAFTGILKNAWTLILPVALVTLWILFSGVVTGLLGRGSGIVLGFAMSAVFSAYFYFVAAVVAKVRTGVSDWKASLGTYFWSWVGLNFVLYILHLCVDLVMAGRQPMQRDQAHTIVTLMSLVVLNAAPETIYLKGTRGGLDTVITSFRFLEESWIEWFIPNLALLGLAYLFVTQVAVLLGPVGLMSLGVVGAALLHVAMVFRGHLYEALNSSTHRQRMHRFGQAR